MINAKKGQIFTLDVLLAIVAITAALGYATMHLEQTYSTSNDLQFQKLYTVASDWAQIGVKRSLAYVDSDGNKRPNIVDLTDVVKWESFESEFESSLTNEYAAEISMGANVHQINEGCDEKSMIAVSSRMVIDESGGAVNWLKVKVCFI